MILRRWYKQDQHQESLQFAGNHLILGMSALDFDPMRVLERTGDLWLEKIGQLLMSGYGYGGRVRLFYYLA